jgi:hypothetical protein
MSTPRKEAAPEFTLSFLQPDRIHQSMAIVQRYVRLRAGNEGPRPGFWEAIRELQHKDLPAKRRGTIPQIIWFEGGHDVFAAALSMLTGGIDSDMAVGTSSYRTSERPDLEMAARRTLHRFANQFPQTYDTFTEMIAFLVLARERKYSGGTVSSRIGLIWLAPEISWSEDTWLENIVHEYVHNCLFLEDMVTNIFVAGCDRLEREDALAFSAIRQIKRGYDKSYHSAFVSFSLIELYLALRKDQDAASFINPLILCLEDLINARRFATAHGLELLVELAERVLPLHRMFTERQWHQINWRPSQLQ